MSGPCYNCPDRHPKCHSECEEYKAFRAELDEANKLRAEETAMRYYQHEVWRKIMKRRKHDTRTLHKNT